ncbi:MAG: ornithine cyclodeaminase family protein [Bacteroidetes bacterium]|jgi:alanine dehydrogenase|nr:ornithine cyclodeaminase family protein [Bacteroidota bacterium]MBT5531281.1 ornithine cyclodeaminase family protein [Cytophagia bacterium]MBT3802515.1 ornithine cyclodeaminase family protein [Bacteroidota bacterium]MBT3933623.1 ornithine cyclodeaminase family protein [Bacteroidota bacterium]MBT4337370.1 ornithine cyclodeaminase family protein [Bacteroidota bacterium]
MTLILSRKDVISVLEMKDCMSVVENAFAELANGTAVLPLRNNIKPPGGLALYMPAYLEKMGALACKVVTVYKNNPSKYNLPTTIGKVLLQDPDTGDVICIMDGGYLTAVRTGAASGVATKYLAREEENLTCAIYGAGVQAKMQLWAVAEARKIAKAYVYDLSTESAQAFADEMNEKFDFDVVVGTPEELVQCDIICTATSAPNPIFDGNDVKEGAHINGIGSHTPNARELDTTIVKRSKFVGDSKEACFKEAGDIMIPLADGEITEDAFYAELGEIITAKKKGRLNNAEITLFKSNGLAIQDVATAKLVYDKAVAAGIGIEVEI